MNESNTLQDILGPAGADWREKRQAFPADPQCPAPPRVISDTFACPSCAASLRIAVVAGLTNGTGSGFAPNGEG